MGRARTLGTDDDLPTRVRLWIPPERGGRKELVMHSICPDCGRSYPKQGVLAKVARCPACKQQIERARQRRRDAVKNSRQPGISRSDLPRRAKERDGYRCRRCGAWRTSETLIVHHRIPVRFGGPHTLDNLITLCRPCHEIVEAENRRIENERKRQAAWMKRYGHRLAKPE
jgi:5-methylcytosine-specific restriction endonuclease McrA